MGKLFEIAGVVTDIAYKFPYTQDMLAKYEYKGDLPAEASVKITVEDYLNEKARSNGESDCFVENSAILRKLSKLFLEKYDAILFHGSSVVYDGKGYIFTAPSGTGKSTHTRLLKEYLGDKIDYINDDKPILKVEDGKVYVYGSPWNGKHGIGKNVKAPLEAICFIERSLENFVTEVAPKDFMKVLFEQSMGFDDEESAEKILKILSLVMEKTKFYLLKCNKDISAAKCSFEGIIYED